MQDFHDHGEGGVEGRGNRRSSTQMKLMYSPCPNDTFLFHAAVHHLIPHPFSFETQLYDIQELNQQALAGLPDVVKVSFHTYAKVQDHYTLLPVGSALGFKNGPKIVSTQPASLEELPNKSLAIPGKDTTAYLLYKKLLPPAQREDFCLYHEVPPRLAERTSDWGLIIHETRFTLESMGLYEVCDLGQLWFQETQLPLPLGCLIAKKSLGAEVHQQLTQALIASYDYAQQHPEVSLPYILEHSMEKDPEVVQAHIRLYVNAETRTLSARGYEAIGRLVIEEPENS